MVFVIIWFSPPILLVKFDFARASKKLVQTTAESFAGQVNLSDNIKSGVRCCVTDSGFILD